METVIAVKLTLENGIICYFMTWGRIQHPTNSKNIEDIILNVSKKFAIPGSPLKAVRCETLREASEATYFYEGLLHFSQQKVPYGDQYDDWRNEMNERMKEGKEIYFLGTVVKKKNQKRNPTTHST